MKKLFVVTRSFQSGKDSETFDQGKFETGLVAAIQGLLDSQKVSGLIILTPKDGKYAEIATKDGLMPTQQAIENEFPAEVASEGIIVQQCPEWGLNAGSASALTFGMHIALSRGAQFIMNWSPELKVLPEHIDMAFRHIEHHNLQVCGFLRSNFEARPRQWMVPQNTGAIWDAEFLHNLGGFSSECNGDGVTTVKTEKFGDVPLAGMEDMHAILRAFKHAVDEDRELPKLGMVCRQNPIFWDLSLKKPGTEEYDNNMKKIERQGEVFKAYAANIFPDKTWDKVTDMIFDQMHID